ncbi:putative cytochrome c oxidase, subunit III [Pseudofrankia inefficax]|uniref:Cytochrome aa3 subunit 3 n=2 Tax=Pseudofrankia inefficax (strain DSM 45817 / CECT 9037 / DDB 130130 / EuI1c) TaxID=298654 RepID=E3IZP8_PSEI1|nr:cytochrome c oxidase subunit 3 [Pseudofrankia inefficax]ADP83966.1 putative cytochrome c oxidase, subunit III [Pseudofrankia inefficax]
MTTAQPTAPTAQKAPKRVPGEAGMWFFVLFETLIFTSYFGVYLYYRAQHEAAYLQAQSHLDLWLGVLGTIALLTSSWSVARCVQTARAGRYQTALRDAALTAGFGVVFLGLKIAEWARQIHAGNTFTSNDFFQYYFFLTAIHCIHLLIGFVVLGVLVHQLSSPRRRSQEVIETCATYWHTVDFLWVLIFALLYVVR